MMMKKLVSLLLALLMVMGGCALAMERSSVEIDWNALEKYAAYEENGTVWTVRSNQTQAALARISADSAPYNGYACFGLELTGDQETGVIVPVLAFYYAGTVQLNGQTASIADNEMTAFESFFGAKRKITGYNGIVHYQLLSGRNRAADIHDIAALGPTAPRIASTVLPLPLSVIS